MRQGDDTALSENLLTQASDRTCKIDIYEPGGEGLLGEGDMFVVHGFLSKEEADDTFHRLDADGGEILYQQWYHMPDAKKEAKGQKLPLRPLTRVKVAQTDRRPDGTIPHYRFPVNNQSRHGTKPFTPTVRMIRDKVFEFLQSSGGETPHTFDLNHAVVLLYRDKEDRIGLHKDKTLDLDDDAPICSVSLGQSRVYVLQDDIHVPTRRQEITLTHGALLVLGPKTNLKWYHSVRTMTDAEVSSHVEEGGVEPGRRVSVTLRAVATSLHEDTNTLTGKSAAYQSLDWPEELKGVHRLTEENEGNS